MLSHLRELIAYRNLLYNLVLRDLKVRYKNSALGVIWSLLNPLLMAVVFSMVFKQAFGGDLRQYYVFFLVGIMPWNFFSGSLMAGTMAMVNNAGLIKKVHFPRELLPMAAVLSNLVNFLIALIVLVIFLFASGLGLSIHALWLPVILATQLIFTLGLALLLGSINVFYRDVLMILDIVMLAWFFLTPVFYPFEQFNTMAGLNLGGVVFEPARVMRWLNPMASIIDGYRTVLWGNTSTLGPVSMAPDFLLRTFVTAVLVFILGYYVFWRTHKLFGEKL
ncbi:MAG: ABC transporter permease [Chloroflexi bacterium]|nr:ABC transporter permease [Chloroflexota bacterium]